MRNVGRTLAFVLASSNHGTMIVNRFDYQLTAPGRGFGVGFQILERGCFDPQEVELAIQLLELRRIHNGDGVVAIDCGANIGVHTVEWAIAMTGWGSVVISGSVAGPGIAICVPSEIVPTRPAAPIMSRPLRHRGGLP